MTQFHLIIFSKLLYKFIDVRFQCGTWNCSNGVSSSIPFNMSPNDDMFVIMGHNYSMSTANLSCTIASADENQSIIVPLTYNGIKIENYYRSLTGTSTILFKFNIRNYFNTLRVNWNISADNKFYQSPSSISIDILKCHDRNI